MRFYITLLVIALFFGCKKTTSDTYKLNQEQIERQDSLFNNVDRKWIFETPTTPEIVQSKIRDWEDWHNLQDEISSKPLSTLSAFRQEAETLALLSERLSATVPDEFNSVAIQSRIALLNTNIQNLDMYMQLDQIPDKKISDILTNINKSMQSIINQMEEILIKKSIPREEGEENLFQHIDTVRKATPKLLP